MVEIARQTLPDSKNHDDNSGAVLSYLHLVHV